MTALGLGAGEMSLMVGLGLASSLHCAAMCGPIVVAASAPLAIGRGPTRPLLGAQIHYQLGRAIAYVLLGVAVAASGATLTAVLPRTAAGAAEIAVGALLVAFGVRQLLRPRAVKAPEGPTLQGRLLRLLLAGRPGRSMLLIGLVTGLLPCGILWAALGRAAVAHTPLAGGVVMLCFCLGTAPALASMGLLSGGLLRLFDRRAAAVLLSVVLAATGGLLIQRGVGALMGTAAPCHHASEPIHRGGLPPC